MRRGILVVAAVASACGRSGFEAHHGVDADMTREDGAPDDVVLASGCVTWDPTRKADSVTLTNGDFEARDGGGLVGATHALTATTGQRAYLEIHVVATDDNAEIGIKDGTFGSLDEYHVDTQGGNLHYDNFEEKVLAKGNGWSVLEPASQGTFDSGDVVMWALDRAAGTIWYGRNGTWIEGGDPIAGTKPSGTGRTSADWFPSVYTRDGSRFEIHASAADFQYTPPAGFPSFGAAVGTGDGACVP